MNLLGRRVHIAGSASARTAGEVTAHAHSLLTAAVEQVVTRGGGFVVGVGREPRPEPAADNLPALTFDWTILDGAWETIQHRTEWPVDGGARIVVVASGKGLGEIPESRKPLWNSLLSSAAMQLIVIQPGARSGAMIRERQSEFGDVLLALGGGTGVEHLADLYVARRRPVIPLDLRLGSSRGDGMGGAERMFLEARSYPDRFLRLNDSARQLAAGLLEALSDPAGVADTASKAAVIGHIFDALAPRRAFYVRLLNTTHADFADVERFFREVVDVEIVENGYERIEVGTDKADHAFINVAIFEGLHYASLVVIDVTGNRANCFMELGYALGRQCRTLVCAREGTVLPFDPHAVPCLFWSPHKPIATTREQFARFWRKNVDRPSVVQP